MGTNSALITRRVLLGLLGMVMAGTLFIAGVPSSAAQAPGQAPAPGGPPPAGRGPAPTPPTAGAHLTIIDGSSASYRVQEQLAGIDFPSDAVGTTPAVSGALVINPDGSIDTAQSKLTIDLRQLKSDQDMRDGFIQKRTLETDKFPEAVFVPKRIKGLPTMIPTQGQTGFELTGDMTIHGMTSEVTFKGIATFGRESTVDGRATTSFTFATFGLTKPTLARLLSVDDNIKLEVVFKFKRT